MKVLLKISVLLIALSAGACTERIDIKTDDAPPRLSVFGYLTNDTLRHTVKISYTSGYFTADAPQGVSGAEVAVTDGERVFPFRESEATPGLYETVDSVCGVEGRTYTLDIRLDTDGNGRSEHYRATATMPYATRVDSVLLSPPQSPLIPIPDLLLYGLVPDIQQNNLALSIYKNNEPQTIFDYFIILPDWYFKGNDIRGARFPCMVEDGILMGDTITFKVSSFAADFAGFISHAKSEAGGKNPIFSGPPADVETNIRAVETDNDLQLVGFFGAFPYNECSTIADRDYALKHP